MIHRLREWEEKSVVRIGYIFPFALPYIRKYQRLCRYLVAGGVAAVVDLCALYGFTEYIGFHYLSAAVIAFVFAFFVSFLLQKFWTFQDESVDRVHRQVFAYFVIALFNLALNTLLMYVFVEWAHLGYIVAQIIASGLLACESFFISRYFIFKIRVRPSSTTV
ncbi:MAG: hypothetical protein COV91_01060 [Candidatus Taylorbacteria bacterium CG11_big_fil_rev_8_21_14_0_20_46_11]|uniref:GtrA/DPMS transmembrane domain-containing protein n=1 Tax=Candidatus Taylorbacteria bacterium CG11_big_fil_rev_8_21_14_0_20_46_11 TaxID=1975025 RepID=A0A2H0KF86_9BACT|nr:MAG: hypothetical protein COV91_01060 [Candidatus Taylorbacteria bacterium CG11_big_fil_rev_8_21_14_0_20_46_11]